MQVALEGVMATPLEQSLKDLAESFTDERTEELPLEEVSGFADDSADELTEPLRGLG
jgi:hypothetical protein